MIKILVSACLLGCRVRYDGSDAAVRSTILQEWRAEGRIIPFCPEVAAGMSIPREPAEIIGGEGGDVLVGEAIVREAGGREVTGIYLDGARRALDLARAEGVKVAVMKDGSPSCGRGFIYDGSFTGVKKRGRGVTVAILERAGVRVFSEAEIEKAAEWMRQSAR
ncbi:MAG: DUF523 domain-containing protein [Chloroflexi bacterium]|nr:DUF523 domain-containing protein [Chloroflexota bacterium]